MTNKYLTGNYAGGYALKPSYSGLILEPTASVGGNGVSSSALATITNLGVVNATGPHGVFLHYGGAVTNGSATDTTALVYGGGGGVFALLGPMTVTNFGTIEGGRANGVGLSAGGVVTNGSATDTAAMISGYADGILDTGGLVSIFNYGTIRGGHDEGVTLSMGGTVTNGSASGTGALITGEIAGVLAGASASIMNFGTIEATKGRGVVLLKSGTLINGSATDTAATIDSFSNAVVGGGRPSMVENFGTIETTRGNGVVLPSGTLINGSIADTTALIECTDNQFAAVKTTGGSAKIVNYGTLANTARFGDAVKLHQGGTLINGGTLDATALIEGTVGLYIGASVTNYGTIQIIEYNRFIQSFGYDYIRNGSLADNKSFINYIRSSGPSNTVVNYGTIGSLYFDRNYSNNLLVVEAGCDFQSAVTGNHGTLRLASGNGTIGIETNVVAVSGDMSPTDFVDFSTVEISTGAQFTDAGAVTVAAGETLDDAGTLSLGGGGKSNANEGLIETTGAGSLTMAGPIANYGTLAVAGGTMTLTGRVTGSGAAIIDGGTLHFVASFTQNVTFTGATGVLELVQSQNYGGSIAGFSVIGGTTLDLVDIHFNASTKASYSGSTSAGVLTVTDGTHVSHFKLTGNYTSATFVVSGDGHGGTVVAAKTGAQASTIHFIAAASAMVGVPAEAMSPGAPGAELTPTLAMPRFATE